MFPVPPHIQVQVHRCGLHALPGHLPFTFYPAMPGNSTIRPQEKWEVQRRAMAAAVGRKAADRRFHGASRCAVGRSEVPLSAGGHAFGGQSGM